MHAKVEKAKEYKSMAIANAITQKRGNHHMSTRPHDNRQETTKQMKIQSLANSHPLQLDKMQFQNYSTLQKYPSINSDPPERKDAEIYGIYKSANGNATGTCLYVGQTTGIRATKRFTEHTKDDQDCPWHISKCAYDKNNQNNWLYDTFQIESLKDATKFEVTCAEQFWIEKKGTLGNCNKVNAITKRAFDHYKNIAGNWEPVRHGFNGWEPH